MDKLDFNSRIKFIMKFGKALHSVGSPAHTLEGIMQEICRGLNITGHIVSLPTAIFSSFSYEDQEVTRIERVEPMGINLGMLTQVDKVARDVIHQKMTLEEGSKKLDEILSHKNEMSKLALVFFFVVCTSGFLVLFGGHWGDFLASLIVGLILGFMSFIKPIGLVAQLYESFIAVIASLATYLIAKFIPSLNVGVVILSSLIIFMPGLFITIAIAEIATQNLTSGTSRLVGGAMILLKLTFGVFVGHKIASWFHYPASSLSFENLPEWLLYVSLPVTAFMSAVTFKTSHQDLKWATLAGIFGFLCAKLGAHYLGAELGMFFGGACVGAMSNIFARVKDCPSSLFQFPGIILLVPGSIGYRSLSFLFEKNLVSGLETAFTMITLAMALVVGIFFGNILISPRKNF